MFETVTKAIYYLKEIGISVVRIMAIIYFFFFNILLLKQFVQFFTCIILNTVLLKSMSGLPVRSCCCVVCFVNIGSWIVSQAGKIFLAVCAEGLLRGEATALR